MKISILYPSLYVVFVLSLLLTGCGQKSNPETVQENVSGITQAEFGKTKEGTPVYLYTLTNTKGMEVRITNYGGIIVSISVPDRNGVMGDVVLGFDSLKQYLGSHPHFGPVVGRYSGFIAKAKFTLDGTEYPLPANAGANHLHGGSNGFHRALWGGKIVGTGDDMALQLTYTSADGEEGYPGNLSVQITYSLSNENELKIDYQATTDKKTHVNLSQHCYFNLSGGKTNNILQHELTVFSDRYAVVDDTMIPTGELRDVKGTPADFTTPMPIGARIGEVPKGYDHNFPLAKSPDGKPVLAARAFDPVSGRVMELYTTRTCIEFASANWLNGTVGKGGTSYTKQYGFLLYPQNLPDSPNQPSFPSTVLAPGQTYQETTIYKFSVK